MRHVLYLLAFEIGLTIAILLVIPFIARLLRVPLTKYSDWADHIIEGD